MKKRKEFQQLKSQMEKDLQVNYIIYPLLTMDYMGLNYDHPLNSDTDQFSWLIIHVYVNTHFEYLAYRIYR